MTRSLNLLQKFYPDMRENGGVVVERGIEYNDAEDVGTPFGRAKSSDICR
jgi:hypothetical protein